MKPDLSQYYEEIMNNLLDECIECGLCVSACPIVKHTDIADLNPKDIQKDLINFLKTGEMKDTVYTKAYSCMECFRCSDSPCPKGFNSLLINEIIKWKNACNISENSLEEPAKEKDDDYMAQKVLASIQVSDMDYEKIFTDSKKQKAKYVFFPGCNVYRQPEKILNALDILDRITDDYAFVPGLDYCCGDLYIYSAKPDKATEVSRKLINKISSYSPHKVILWCPTCSCRFINTISAIEEIPFEIITFSQFLTENIDKLKFVKEINKTVTLHEPCKTSYTGIDLISVRKILTSIPNIKLIEMKHHGENTVCCGSGSVEYFPESFEKMKLNRLKEAQETNADILIDVCHYCHETFVTEEFKYGFEVENYINLVAHALGINREDKFKKYKQSNDIGNILEYCNEFIKDSPYTRKQILDILIKEFKPKLQE
jgi:Fe-S oxidoreductase